MNFIEIAKIDYTGFTVLISVAAVLLIGAIVWLLVASSRNELSVGTNVGLGALLLFSSALAVAAYFSTPSSIEARADQLKEVRSSIADRYDIRLSQDELQDLDYPKTEPKKDFEVFGTVTRDVELKGGFERQEVSLLWRDGRFELAQSNDGQGFTALKPRGGEDRGSVSEEPFFAPSSAATEKPSND